MAGPGGGRAGGSPASSNPTAPAPRSRSSRQTPKVAAATPPASVPGPRAAGSGHPRSCQPTSPPPTPDPHLLWASGPPGPLPRIRTYPASRRAGGLAECRRVVGRPARPGVDGGPFGQDQVGAQSQPVPDFPAFTQRPARHGVGVLRIGPWPPPAGPSGIAVRPGALRGGCAVPATPSGIDRVAAEVAQNWFGTPQPDRADGPPPNRIIVIRRPRPAGRGCRRWRRGRHR